MHYIYRGTWGCYDIRSRASAKFIVYNRNCDKNFQYINLVQITLRLDIFKLGTIVFTIS